MCPIVPMFTCGLLRSNFSLAMDISLSYLDSDSSLLRNPSLYFGDDFLRYVLGDFLVLSEMHCETPAALRARPKLGGISKHFRQRHHRLDQLRGSAHLGAFQAAAARAQVTVHRAHVLFRHDHLDTHDRFEQYRPGPPAG